MRSAQPNGRLPGGKDVSSSRLDTGDPGTCPDRRRACSLVLATLLLAPAGMAGTVQRFSLNGPWERWTDEEHHAPVTVPFSSEPVGTPVAFQRFFTLPTDAPRQLVLLSFDAIVGKGDVYLNGTHLGRHGSYTPFQFDVTALVDPAGPNELIVVIDDRRDATTIPYTDIPWVSYSGIIRDVDLVCVQDAVLLAGRPRYSLSADLSHVEGAVRVEARTTSGRSLQFAGALLRRQDDAWTTAAILPTTTVVADAGGLASTDLPFALDSPALWSPERPDLYYLYTVALAAGVTVDEQMVPTGFRTVATSGQDILLNNAPLLLKGVSYHPIYPGTGHVDTTDQMRADLLRIKAAGCNYVRTIHYPQDPRLLDLADEIGLLISEEVPAWANFWDPAVREGLYDMLREMILRDMHHPSIFLWVTGNARAWPVPYAREARDLLKSLDPGRLCSYVIDNDQYDPETIGQDVAFVRDAGLDLYMKITWWFYYVEYLQDAWTNFPKDLPIVISEFGREGNDREPIVVDEEQQYWLGEEQQADAVIEMLEAWRPHLPQYDAEDHITGLIYFNYQDLDWPDIQRYLPNHIPSVHHGLVYEDRTPKKVLGALGNFYSTLPTSFVGLPQAEDAHVERGFVAPAPLPGDVNQAYRDSGPSLSQDGATLYFASDGPDHVGLPRLFLSLRGESGWLPPELVAMPQETEPFAFRGSPCISYDDQALYFTRAVISGIYVARTRLWCSRKSNGAWQAPVDLGDGVNDPDPARTTSDPSISADGTRLFFTSDRAGGHGRTDLWMSRLVDGEWAAPMNLGPTVNTPAGESEPAISPDGQTLYFTSDRPGGLGGSDLWVTHWTDGRWSEPRNLGPDVNSPGADREPEVSKDGRTLLFTGIRSGGSGLSDLWSARSRFRRGDFDRDGDVDAADFAWLQRCFTGPSRPQLLGACMQTRLDNDTDVDSEDVARFIDCATGPALPVEPTNEHLSCY